MLAEIFVLQLEALARETAANEPPWGRATPVLSPSPCLSSQAFIPKARLRHRERCPPT